MATKIYQVKYLIGLLTVGLLTLSGFIFFSTIIIFNAENFLKRSLSSREIISASPADKNFYETAFRFVKNDRPVNGEIIAAITPHHLLAADLIAELYQTIGKEKFNTIVLIGPNHYNLGPDQIQTTLNEWQTPYGLLSADTQLGKKLLSDSLVKENNEVFKNEHSINSQVSFIKKVFPLSTFLPLILKSGTKPNQAEELARGIIKAAGNKRILVIVSVDFSHQTTNLTAQANDQVSLKTLNDFNFDQVDKLAVDSPAALYTLMKYCQLKNSQFQLITNTNSALLSGNLDLADVTSYLTGIFILPSNSLSVKGLNLLFFGDIMLDRHVGEKIKQNSVNWLLGDLPNKLKFYSYDLISANSEGAVTNKGDHYSPVIDYDFAFSPEVVSELKQYHFNFFNLANNHLADQGERGVIETENNLDNLGVNYSGCTDGVVSDCSSKIIELAGKKLAMVGLSMVYHDFNLAEAEKIIKDLVGKCDTIIVNIHWGNEYQHQYNKKQQQVAHNLIDSGADIIIGHHPHVVQGIEVYKAKPIFYSLGNFIFDQYFSSDTQQGLAVGINLTNQQKTIFLFPVKSVLSQVELMSGQERDKFLENLTGWSIADGVTWEQIKNGKLIFYD